MAGTRWIKPDEIGEVFKSYFQLLFTFEGVEECTAAVSGRVSPALNKCYLLSL
jgi:hypothetical protein